MKQQQSSISTRRRRLQYPVVQHKQEEKTKSSHMGGERRRRCCRRLFVHPSHATILLSLVTIFILTTILSYNQQQSSFLFIQAQQTVIDAENSPQNHSPTLVPSSSSMTSSSSPPPIKKNPVPSDHYYCGLGFDNLFDCANPCPGGDSAECPQGQICYFNTPCPLSTTSSSDGSATTTTNTNTNTTGSSSSVESQKQEGVGEHNFCGKTVTEAGKNCNPDLHCPSGLNSECPEGMYCWLFLPDCDFNLMPTNNPTISPRPTRTPTITPTTRAPDATYSPTWAPLTASEDHFFCGTSWTDASERCHMRCTEFSTNCPDGEDCFNNVPCWGKMNEPPPSPANEGIASPSGSPFSGTRAPTISPKPTLQPVEKEATRSPTHAPLAKDDMRNFFFCGTSWMDASRRCYKRCLSGHHIECPNGEQCFAQADCRGLITPPPASAAPFAGSRSPTFSPAPTMFPTEPQPTGTPAPPNNDPTESPTTPWPTFQPTFAPCKGEPCPDKEQCRSKTGFCGAGVAYCKNPSWDASCGVPTNPPVSSAPTSSLQPTSPSPPPSNSTNSTGTSSYSPTKAPSSDLFSPSWFSESSEPTNNSSNATVDPDEQYFAPDDPRGTYFCGTDWNHAITECPTRCPNGEATECPNGWFCYAFTPCTNVGNIKPPSLKPTWEPTMKPIIRPTRMPLDPQHGGTTQPTGQQGWQQPPTVKPTYKPTGDRCRATPCEVSNQCRSKLGFCGVGIIYCNSESSWEPECDPNYSVAIRGPSHAPSTLFDSWLGKQPDVTASNVTASDVTASDVNSNSTSVAESVNEVYDDKAKEEEQEKAVTYTDFTEGWGSDSQENKETQAWWRVTSSASRAISFFPLKTFPLLGLLLWQ